MLSSLTSKRRLRDISILAFTGQTTARVLVPVFVGLSLAATILSARADEAAPAGKATFANKWEAGQKWTYNVDLAGKLDIRNPSGMKAPLAGMVFKDVDFSLNNRLTLDVLESQTNGEGLIAFRNQLVKMRADAEIGSVVVDRGQIGVLVNGEAYGNTIPLPMEAMLNPRQAMRLDQRGHCVGVKDLPQTGNATPANFPIDISSFVQLMNPRFLPALWPENPIAAGESWESKIELPLPNAEPEEKNAGSLNWTYKGAGPDPKNKERTLQQVDVQGEFHIEESQAAIIAKANGDTGTPQESTDSVTGSIWFDPAIGQVRYGRFNVKIHNSSHIKTEFNGQTIVDEPYMDFEGTVFLALVEKPAS